MSTPGVEGAPVRGCHDTLLEQLLARAKYSGGYTHLSSRTAGLESTRPLSTLLLATARKRAAAIFFFPVGIAASPIRRARLTERHPAVGSDFMSPELLPGAARNAFKREISSQLPS